MVVKNVGIFLLLTLQSGCAVFGIRTAKEPKYKLVLQEEKKEIRSYEGYVVVSTTKASEQRESFDKLFKYISGHNEENSKIDMSAPVLQEKKSVKIEMTAPVLQEGIDKNNAQMAFVLPEKYLKEPIPKPLDESLVIKKIEAKNVAVLRYSGTSSEEKMAKLALELQNWLKEKKIKPQSGWRSALYDPPFTIPFFRRNEIHIDVSYP